MKKTAIILDVDGTLWDSTPIVAKAWNHGLQTIGVTDITLTADRLKQVFGKTMTEIGEILFPSYTLEEQYKMMEACFAFEHQYIEENTEDIFFSGIEATIPVLAEDHKIFIVSNCQTGYIEVMLEKSNFAHCIQDIECFGNTQKSKGENIKLIMERNQIEQAVYVGDTQGDFEASTIAGTPFIFAAYGFGQVDAPYKTMHAFSDLPALMSEEA